MGTKFIKKGFLVKKIMLLPDLKRTHQECERGEPI